MSPVKDGGSRRKPAEGRKDGIESRMEQVRLYLRGHHAGVEPDAGFADRVVARLDRPATDLLGWAAWKLLPATLALVLVLVWFAFQVAPASEKAASTSPVDDPLAWVLGESEATQ